MHLTSAFSLDDIHSPVNGHCNRRLNLHQGWSIHSVATTPSLFSAEIAHAKTLPPLQKFFKLYHNKKIHNSKIKCIDEGTQKDTGGGLIKLKKKIKKDFFLFNGDSYFDVNLNILFKKFPMDLHRPLY